jgi:hypothetical protein
MSRRHLARRNPIGSWVWVVGAVGVGGVVVYLTMRKYMVHGYDPATKLSVGFDRDPNRLNVRFLTEAGARAAAVQQSAQLSGIQFLVGYDLGGGSAGYNVRPIATYTNGKQTS